MFQITVDQLNEALDRAVAEKGADYVYPNGVKGDSCLYVEDRVKLGEDEDGWPKYDEGTGKPSCIVGHVYYYVAGELVPSEFEENNAAALPAWADDEARLIAVRTQYLQDRGATWGDAVAQARADVAAGIVNENGYVKV